MVKTTHAQRVALKKLWERDLADKVEAFKRGERKPLRSYRSIRKSVVPYFDGSGCVMVPLWGMWLGIETDGYTHS